ncbi:hypothetical protein [Bifidobacterium myosotis]|uniref:hypothetical protein n=1 Tax=Bifidobacterium myosotis TaxID=1630166 RepID=UPI00168BBF35|nr:hypothetical protein [Bifidobacterium myosotis]
MNEHAIANESDVFLSTEHYTVHRTGDVDDPFRIGSAVPPVRPGGEPWAAVVMEWGVARVRWAPMPAVDDLRADWFAALVSETARVARAINASVEGKRAARANADWLARR